MTRCYTTSWDLTQLGQPAKGVGHPLGTRRRGESRRAGLGIVRECRRSHPPSARQRAGCVVLTSRHGERQLPSTRAHLIHSDAPPWLSTWLSKRPPPAPRNGLRKPILSVESGEPAGIRTQDTRIKSLSAERAQGRLEGYRVHLARRSCPRAPPRSADLHRRGCQRGCQVEMVNVGPEGVAPGRGLGHGRASLSHQGERSKGWRPDAG